MWLAVVAASHRIGARRLSCQHMKHYLADLEPWVQGQRVEPAGVLQFQRQLAAMPAWVAVPGQHMAVPLAGAA